MVTSEITTTSRFDIAGTGGNAGQAGYSSGKAGVIGLTKTMAKEWGRYQVTVNGVAFGLIRTRLTEASVGADATIRVNDHDIEVGIGEELMRSMEQGIPMGRAGTPTDAADAGYLFCAPESNYITGQVIGCGGGMVYLALTHWRGSITESRRFPHLHEPRRLDMADIKRLPGPWLRYFVWQLNAACRGMDSAVFFHPPEERNAVREDRIANAKAIYGQCLANTECPHPALEAMEPYGIWGGLSG